MHYIPIKVRRQNLFTSQVILFYSLRMVDIILRLMPIFIHLSLIGFESLNFNYLVTSILLFHFCRCKYNFSNNGYILFYGQNLDTSP